MTPPAKEAAAPAAAAEPTAPQPAAEAAPAVAQLTKATITTGIARSNQLRCS
ncbi:hypothetical protein [Roseateles sp. P5_E4]